MVKRNSNIDKTLKNLSLNKEAPKSAFILLVLLYTITSVLTTRTSVMQGSIAIGDQMIKYNSFTGVFSMLGYICIICLVMLFRRVGYIVSMAAIILQFPLMIFNIFVRGNLHSLPGLFSSVLMIGAISIIHFNYKKVLNYQQSIREQAVTDRITGLPNRFACNELLTDLQRRGEPFVLVSVDLNDFKSINDTMGHDTGDQVLREVARRWKELANSLNTETVDFVARNSGDEFMIVISEYPSVKEIENTINAFREVLEKKITIDDCDYYLTACFGYSFFPEDSDVIENIYLFSDAALHEVKKAGSGSRISRFTPEVLSFERNLEIERKIRTALNSDKIFFNLQPQYDINHNLRGFEALARMKDDDGSFISPADFIPVAEKTGLVDKIDMRVFELSMEFLEKVTRETGTEVMMSVNVSVRHLMKNTFIEDIKNILKAHNIAPERVEIEITESIMIDSAEKALQCINEIRSMGIMVAIDDFGTGYSSLSYLNNFPANLLKIDKSFIDKMNTSDSSKQYVAAIISIGHIMGFDVISEGVETEDQLATLNSIGCDYIQGFIWGRPLPQEEAEKLVMASVQTQD